MLASANTMAVRTAKDSDEMAVYKEFPTHVTAWSYMFGAIAMIVTAGAEYLELLITMHD